MRQIERVEADLEKANNAALELGLKCNRLAKKIDELKSLIRHKIPCNCEDVNKTAPIEGCLTCYRCKVLDDK